MERTSLITALYVAHISYYSSVTLDSDGMPDASSLDTFFEEVPLVLESSDYREEEDDSPQGHILQRTVRARIYRDSDFYLKNRHQLVMLYLETANEERHFLGTTSYPLQYLSNRSTGVSNTDTRDTELTYRQIVPV